MARRTNPSEDNWHNVADSRKRKQIQDRLAQRARRQRLREAKNNAKPASEDSETRPSGDAQDGGSQVALMSAHGSCPIAHGAFDVAKSSSDTTALLDPALLLFDCQNMQVPSCHNITDPVPKFLSPTSQPQAPLNVFGALYINGQILGLVCHHGTTWKSRPQGPDVPGPLHPTEMQLTYRHTIWIDRLPWPRVRDAMISMSEIIDEDELVGDIFTMPSFEIVPGRMPWDPRAWKIEKVFAEKWGYLFIDAYS